MAWNPKTPGRGNKAMLVREDRLLDRIRRWETQPLDRGRGDPQRTIDSVIRHLQRLLNTHQGSAPIADDYGIPDFTNYLQGGRDAIVGVESAIRQVIESYEPRLTAIRVQYVAPEEGVPTLRFQVQARLRMESKLVFLETWIGPDGKISVKG
jgi:type VI secretion system protein